MHQIRDVLSRKAIGPSSRSRRSTRAKTSLVEYRGDFRVNVVVE